MTRNSNEHTPVTVRQSGGSSSKPTSARPFSRGELFAVVLVTLVGGLLRFAFLNELAIEHFDEGVYASNLCFPDEDFRYPQRHLYAPSLLPSLIEWSILLFGGADFVPLLPSLVFGTLMIPLAWCVGRTWFGPVAGIASASLLAFSELQIAFSRSALTDAMLCFWLLLAVGLFEFTFRHRDWRGALAAGLATGLAWWTKYNGWLPLAIAASGLASWWVLGWRTKYNVWREVILIMVAGLIAGVMWQWECSGLPNGYAEVAINHRRYVEGWDRWLPNLFRQQSAHRHFDGWVTIFGIGMAGVIGLVATARGRVSAAQSPNPARLRVPEAMNFSALILAWLAVVVVVVKALGSSGALVIASAASLVWYLRNSRSIDAEHNSLSRSIGFWLLAAWWCGLLLATPHYRAYPRLTLPWHLATLLWAGMAVQVASGVRSRITSAWLAVASNRGLLLAIVSLAVIVGAVVVSLSSPITAPTWEPRNQLAGIARKLRDDALSTIQELSADRSGIRLTIYVYAEPGLFFHLPTTSIATMPAGNLEFLDIDATRQLPTFLVVGPHALRDPDFQKDFQKAARQLQLVKTYEYQASDFVQLDELSSPELRRARPPLEVRLYRARPTLQSMD